VSGSRGTTMWHVSNGVSPGAVPCIYSACRQAAKHTAWMASHAVARECVVAIRSAEICSSCSLPTRRTAKPMQVRLKVAPSCCTRKTAWVHAVWAERSDEAFAAERSVQISGGADVGLVNPQANLRRRAELCNGMQAKLVRH
jgi:hypothetical protein